MYTGISKIHSVHGNLKDQMKLDLCICEALNYTSVPWKQYLWAWLSITTNINKADQEQRTAPQRRQVGVAPGVTWRVGGALRSFVHVVGAQFPPRMYLLAVQSATNARTL